MSARLTLLAGACVALSATSALRAQEVQITFTGMGCPGTGAPPCFATAGQPAPLPYTYSFDVNTASAQLVTIFQTINGVSYLGEFQATGLAVTNISAVIGGKSVPSPASSTGGFQLTIEGVDSYEFDVQSTPTSGLFGTGFSTPVFTEAQYRSLQNPVFSILTTSSQGGGFLSFESVDGSSQFQGDNFGIMVTPISSTPVPEPGVLALLFPGLAGLWLLRRRRA